MSPLFQQFIEPENFSLAWEQVRSNNGCAGVDGETIGQFQHQAEHHLETLRHSLITNTYRPLPLRQIIIPKKSGGWRELGVPTIRDRIVQQALLQVLHPVIEPQFEPSSYAYRPGRSHQMAVRQISQWRDRGYDWVLDADIVKYFNNIQHSRLLAEVAERINESWILDLIQRWITTGILTREGILLPQKGVPQGAVISPILANIYLDDFDEAMAQVGWKLVRYADDFVLLSRSQQRLIQGKATVEQLLDSMGLEIHPGKTQITTFDKGFRFLGHAFAGDVVVPFKGSRAEDGCKDGGRRKEDRNGKRKKTSHDPFPPSNPIPPPFNSVLIHADPVSAQPTQMQQALVEALKQRQEPIPPPLYVVLGYRVRESTPVAIESNEVEWRNGMSSLYLIQQGTKLNKEQGRFILDVPKENRLEIPIREVDRILVFGNIQLTNAVITTCLELHIPVVFLSQLGDYKGHLWSADSANLPIETAQFQRRGDEPFQITTARAIVQGKLWNSKLLLLRLNRKRQIPDLANTLTALDQDRQTVMDLENPLTIDQIRGYEGTGAARYFRALEQMITNPGFSFTRREFHPPTDPFNSLLSFGYTLLYNNVFSLLLAEGLNPYLGHLHGAERQKAYLAFDLMEEFRSPIVDTVVIKLVNRKILSPTDFTYPTQSGGVYLTDPARRIFLKHIEARLSEETTHPDVKEPISYRRVIHLQIQRYRAAVIGNQPYEPFLR